MRLIPLMSGSSGNATYVEAGKVRLLVDAGATCKKVVEQLTAIGVTPDSLTAVLVTHEHIDHVRGIGVLARRYGVPIYACLATWRQMPAAIGEIPAAQKKAFEPGMAFTLSGVSILPFPVPHDSVSCVGFRIDDGTARCGITTDSGCMTEEMLTALTGCGVIMLEANHDVEMLRAGPYPYELQMRILARDGHLSNADCGAAVAELARRGTREFILAHLSEDNNIPFLARATVCSILHSAGFGEEIHVTVAERYQMTGIFPVPEREAMA